MATNFPTSVDVLTNPVSNDSLNSPSHSTQHANANDAIEAVEDYLLNGAGRSGLVLLKTQAVGSGVSSVNVTAAFNATYENYKIIYSGGVASGAGYLTFKLGTSSSGWYGGLNRVDYSTGAVSGLGVNNPAQFSYAGALNVGTCGMNIDLFAPFAVKYTLLNAFYIASGNFYGSAVGDHEVNASYTDFTIATSTGTITGGTIYVYGYKAA